VRNKTVKKSARTIIERFYPRLTNDFQVNKKVCQQVAIISTKRLRNKIAGFLTHLMVRIEKVTDLFIIFSSFFFFLLK
jgi:small subunit ribosomal protein S17e